MLFSDPQGDVTDYFAGSATGKEYLDIKSGSYELKESTLDLTLELFSKVKDSSNIQYGFIITGSPNKADTHGAHGAPLGEDEVRLTKAAYGWPEDAHFLIPPEVVRHFAQGIGQRGQAAYEQWSADFARYSQQFPREAAELQDI